MKQMGIQEIKEIRMWQFFTLSSRSSSWRFNNIGNAFCCEYRGIPATVAPDQESLSKETGLKNEYRWTQENDQKGKSGQWEQRVHRCLKSYPTLRSFSLTLYRGVWGEWESDLWTSGGELFHPVCFVSSLEHQLCSSIWPEHWIHGRENWRG